MLNFIGKIFSLNDEKSKNNSSKEKPPESNINNIEISDSLEVNRKNIENIFSNCSDLVVRELKIANNPVFTAMILYFDNLIKTELIENAVVKKLVDASAEYSYNPGSKEYSKYLFGITDKNVYKDMSQVVNSILGGNAILLINGIKEALAINISTPPGREVEEPQVENITRGPREGFTEALSIGLALIRKRIKSPNLKVESFTLGRESKTNIAVIYLAHIVNDKIVREVRERLSKIDVDTILGANYITEYITDNPTSPFPSVFTTERPDVVAGKLLEGRIAILVDGSPTAITLPALFVEFLITSEDYYVHFTTATFNRWIRYTCFFISLTLPGIFVATTTFHQELIPTQLLTTFINARAEVPFSALLECLLMLFAYQILREAGIRMPKNVGQAISVIGALILGQSAVEAGLVSTPMVIVVATTAISSYAIPSTDMNEALTIPRLVLLFLGGAFGLLGVVTGMIILAMKLIDQRTFGIPYMIPVAPIIKEDLPDVPMRRPSWAKFNRKWFITGRRSIRRKEQSRLKAIDEEQEKAMEEKNDK